MFEGYKGRQAIVGQRYFVYRNLHTGRWSLRAVDGEHRGKVVAHARKVALREATFSVNEAGRQRVIAERRKNVHAGVVGVLAGGDFGEDMATTRVTYNPRRAGRFVLADRPEVAVLSSDRVELDAVGKAYIF